MEGPVPCNTDIPCPGKIYVLMVSLKLLLQMQKYENVNLNFEQLFVEMILYSMDKQHLFCSDFFSSCESCC